MAPNPVAYVNSNNNYQAPMLPGALANPTPGTIVVHINAKVQVSAAGVWTSADTRAFTAPNGSPGAAPITSIGSGSLAAGTATSASATQSAVLGVNGTGTAKVQPQVIGSFAEERLSRPRCSGRRERHFLGLMAVSYGFFRFAPGLITRQAASAGSRHKRKDRERNRDDTEPDANDPKKPRPPIRHRCPPCGASARSTARVRVVFAKREQFLTRTPSAGGVRCNEKHRPVKAILVFQCSQREAIETALHGFEQELKLPAEAQPRISPATATWTPPIIA